MARGDPREWLSGPALELYEHLEAVGEVRLLKAMPHSGAVAWVHPEAEHARWHFVEMMLWLAARMAPLDSLFEGFGKVEIEGHRVGAGRDLLQCWAMLNNGGHLWGLFATERLVMDALAVPGAARDLFLQGLPTEVDRAYADWVIEHYLVHKFATVLATGFINNLPEHRQAPGRGAWLAMLRAFGEPGLHSEKVMQLWRAYGQLANLVQLYLSLAHAHLPVSLDLAAIERDPAHYLGDLLGPPTAPLQALLDNLSRYVPLDIYLAPEVMLAARLLQEAAGPRVRQDLNDAESPQDLFGRVHALRTAAAWPVVDEVLRAMERREYVHWHRVHRRRPEAMEAQDFAAQTPRLQSQLGGRVGADTLIHVAGDVVAEQFVDFLVRPSIGAADLARTVTVICEMITTPPAPPDEQPAPRPRRGPQVRALVTSLLLLLLKTTLMPVRESLELQNDASFLLVDGRNADYVHAALERVLAAGPGATRRRELEALSAALRATPVPDFRLVMLSGFEVRREPPRGEVLTEFDGAFLDVTPEALTLHVVEAESRLDSQATLSEVRDRLERLGWLGGARVAALPVARSVEAVIPVRF